MEKIIPFRKDIIFKTNLSEITSISLEHNLSKQDQFLISGTFTISGEYKMAEDSVILDSFSYELPFDINIDDRYDTDHMTIDIDDFYYEIVNDNVLSVSIDVLLAKLEEIPVEKLEEIKEEISDIEKNSIVEEDVREESFVEQAIEMKEQTTTKIDLLEEKAMEIEEQEEKRCIEPEGPSLFENVDATESYRSYKIYIVRQGDTLEKIMESYQVSKEALAHYNDLSELKINDKIIIPAITDENV